MIKEIYVYGCGGVGNELADILSNDACFKFMGFIDDNPEIRDCMGFKSHTLEEIVDLRNAGKIESEINVIISIGEPAIREEVSNRIAFITHKIQELNHSSDLTELKEVRTIQKIRAVKEVTLDLSDHFNPKFSTVEAGTLLHQGSYVSVHAHIGKCCMINKGTLVGHDSTIGNYSVLAPNVTLGGNVNIGNSTYVGTGASIRNGINIGNNVIVGMGAVVIDDVEDEAVVVGNPAKFIKKNEKRRVFEKIATPPRCKIKFSQSLFFELPRLYSVASQRCDCGCDAA